MTPDAVHESILNFLTSGLLKKQVCHCVHCGSIKAYTNVTFFYEGQSWEVNLPVCLECDLIPDHPTHDA